jgi:hypothetical protein
MLAAIRSDTQIQTLAHIEHVRIGGDKLGSVLAKKRKHFFPCRVDEYHFRQINEKLSACGEARCQRASVFSIITGESAYQPQDQGLSRIAYFHSEHPASLVCE